MALFIMYNVSLAQCLKNAFAAPKNEARQDLILVTMNKWPLYYAGRDIIAFLYRFTRLPVVYTVVNSCKLAFRQISSESVLRKKAQ